MNCSLSNFFFDAFYCFSFFIVFAAHLLVWLWGQLWGQFWVQYLVMGVVMGVVMSVVTGVVTGVVLPSFLLPTFGR